MLKQGKPDKKDKTDSPETDRRVGEIEDTQMAITNPLAVKFSNEKARVLADAMIDSYESAKAFVAYWTDNSLASLFPDDAAQVVTDGADVDGRPVATGAKVNAMLTAAQALITWYETGTPSRISRLRQFAVNGRSRF